MYHVILLNIKQRTWDETRVFCNQNGMRFAAIESYTEDMAIWNAWGGGQEVRGNEIPIKICSSP